MNRQTHIAIYARVSSDQQAQQGTIDSQLAAVQKFAAETGLKVRSGSDLRRQRSQRFHAGAPQARCFA